MNVLILTTDAGGGHRSVAKALAAGFEEAGGAACNVRVVDYLASYAPFPLSRARAVYTFLMRYPFLYDVFYASTNTRRGRTFDAPAVGLTLEAGMSRLLHDYSPDVVVATHPMGAAALSSLLYRRRDSLPYYTVVTDYGSLHSWWSYPFGELWFAPCQETAEDLIRSGIPAGRVVVSGYPVHPRFARRTRPATELRQELGLEPDRFTALLVGGAEGVGPLQEIVEAIASAPAPWQLIVVTGRNHALLERLESQAANWAIPVRLEGLVDDMPSRMHAADLLLTKAGGSTLSEGLTCGLPMLMISVLPGQEEENAAYFERLGAARRMASPAEIRAALAELSTPGSAGLERMRACTQAAQPFASLEIARRVLDSGQTVTASPISPLYGLRLLNTQVARSGQPGRPLKRENKSRGTARAGANQPSHSHTRTKPSTGSTNVSQEDEAAMNVLILTADVGGGHRSVARALAAGFEEIGGRDCRVNIVDFLAGYAPFPLSRAREVYSFLMRYPTLWGMFFATTNTSHGRAWNAPAVGLAMEAGMARLLREHRPDIIVATHPLGAPALNSLLYRRRESLPYYTVVTDFGGVHTWWAYPFGELWFAPCEQTADHLVRSGIPAERIAVTGYPVHPRFALATQPAAELRQALDLEPDRFTVLLISGAEGVGPIEEIVQALAGAEAPWQLIVVTGRNRALKERLDSQAANWAIPVHIDGLVDDMPSRMRAANVLLTKGGPATLSEGLTSGLPAIIFSMLPGQEEDDARHFIGLGVARYMSEPAEVRAAVAELTAPKSAALEHMLACIRQATPPPASLEIARQILSRGTMVTAPRMSPLSGLLPLPRNARQQSDIERRHWLP